MSDRVDAALRFEAAKERRTDWTAKRAALPERWTGKTPMSAFEMAAAVYRDSLIDMLVVPVSMYDLTAYDRRGLLNLVAALLDRVEASDSPEKTT